MISELKELIKQSSEEERQSLLLQILYRIQMLEETTYSEIQFAKDMKQMYQDFLVYKSTQTIAHEKNNQAIHILFGDSPSGSLKAALKDMALQNSERIINFSDLFSIGPIWKLHEEVGVANRHEWLKDHINVDEEYIDNYSFAVNRTVQSLIAIPSHVPIIIWAGTNAHEQTALRFVLYVLREKENPIILIDATTDYQQLFHIPEIDYFPLHTGEITPEKLGAIYEYNRNATPLSKMERIKFEEEWETLSAKQEVLRTWKNQEIHNVAEDHYDDYIIHTARNLHHEQENKDFIKSARLIGHVIGHLKQYIGDSYVEYRVRQLILNGVFDLKGIPKAMRFYSIKLH